MNVYDKKPKTAAKPNHDCKVISGEYMVKGKRTVRLQFAYREIEAQWNPELKRWESNEFQMKVSKPKTKVAKKV